MRRLVVIVFVQLVVVALCPTAAAAEIVLRPPVETPVVDPFRAPAGPYGPGNRGIEYGTTPGTLIRAAGPGTVVFAGPVAGSLHVTIDHGSGLRTSYSFVDRILVRRGDTVAAGTVVARAGGRFHFGARIDGVYVDPASLFGRRHVVVYLVAHDDPDAFGEWLDLVERSERVEFLPFASAGGGGFGPGAILGVVGDVLAFASYASSHPWTDPAAAIADLARLAEAFAALTGAADPALLVSTLVAAGLTALVPPPCTSSGVSVAPRRGRRIALVANGLGSSSGPDEAMAGLDLAGLGYAPEDIARFSYAGGVVAEPAADGWQQAVPSSTYEGADTHGPVPESVAAFIATLEAIATANPGVTIDIYGHSLGGLVSRHAVAAVAGPDGSVDVGVVMTFASPHRGTPAAQLLLGTSSIPGGAEVLGLIGQGELTRAPVVADLAPGGFAGHTADVAFPPGVHAVTVGSRTDLVVPIASAPGARHVVLGDLPELDAHGALPSHPDVPREVELALAGLDPACEGWRDRVADAVVPPAVAWGESTLADTATLAGDLVPG